MATDSILNGELAVIISVILVSIGLNCSYWTDSHVDPMCIQTLVVMESQDTGLEGVIEIIFSSPLQSPFCGLSLLCSATGYNVVGTSPLCSKQRVELIQTHFFTFKKL